MNELKPCPFCGSKAKTNSKVMEKTAHFWVSCTECGASSAIYTCNVNRIQKRITLDNPQIQPMVNAWNKRVEQTEPQFDKDINVRSKYEPKICDTCRYYNSNIPCGSTPSACKEADKFAEEFVDGLKKLKPKVEPQTSPTISKMEQVEDEPQTERHLPDYSYEADLGRRIMKQTDCPWK